MLRQHTTTAYKDGFKWTTYCIHCSLEDEYLASEPVCVGRYISPLTPETIKKMEERIDRLKEVF